jgi:hypothetical protein
MKLAPPPVILHFEVRTPVPWPVHSKLQDIVFPFIYRFLPKPKGKTETRLKATQNAFLFTAVVLFLSAAQQVAVPTVYLINWIIFFK